MVLEYHPTDTKPTGEIHRYLMLDGTYFNGYCALVAYNGTNVVSWLFCDREKNASWTLLLQDLPAPDIAGVDGNGPLERVIRSLWPDTALQRCYFHIRQRIHTHLTRNPRTHPGRELLALIKTLNQLRTADQAAAFSAEIACWASRWDSVLKQRTYANQHRSQRPAHVKPHQKWWYTHLRLRRAHKLIHQLITGDQQFTGLTQAQPDEALPKTTHPAGRWREHRNEGTLTKTSRLDVRTRNEGHGLVPVFQDRKPADPWTLVTPAHWQPTRTIRKQSPASQRIGPALYDTSSSPEDGNGIQHGLGGRSR